MSKCFLYQRAVNSTPHVIQNDIHVMKLSICAPENYIFEMTRDQSRFHVEEYRRPQASQRHEK